MADAVVQLPADGAGKKLDAESLTVGLNTVYRERIQISGDSATDIAPVTAADGLLVDLGTNNDVTVTGSVAVTNAGLTELAAAIDTELQVDVVGALPTGTNSIGQVTANAGTNLNTSALALEAGNLATAVASLSVLDDWDETDRAKVNIIAGQVGVAGGAGSVSALTQRVVVATDQTAIPVSGTVSITGSATEAKQDTQITHLATIAGDTTDIETAVELIDDTVAVLGTDVYTEATTKGLIIGAIRRDADTTLVSLTNEVSPLQVDANGRLKVEAFSGETLPISGTVTANLAAGTNNIGDVDVLSSALPTGASTLTEQQTQTTTLAAIQTSVQLIDDSVKTLGTDLYTEATTKGLVIGGVRRDADTTLVDTTNEVAPFQIDALGRLKVEAFSGETLPVSLTSTTVTGTVTVDTELPAAAALADNTANPTVPGVGSFLMAFDGTNWDRVQTGAAATGSLKVDGSAVTQPVSLTSTTITGTVTVDTELPAAAALADAAANPTTPLVGAALETFNGTTWDRARGDTTNGLDVDVTRLPALVAGNANIGDVDIASAPTGSSSITVQGTAAHAAAAVGNPVYVGGRASTALPTDVGADADVAAIWVNRNGLVVSSAIPGAGLNADPYTLLSVGAQYTTTQTSAVLLAGGASERIFVTAIQIQVGGTTAGTLQVYFGTGAFARGTNSAIFDGEFAPSATLKPGFNSHPPSGYRSPTLGHDVLVTTSAAINPLTITIWYYILGV